MSTSSSHRDRLGMLLVGVSRRWRAALDASLADVGLSDATWRPLIYVSRAGRGLSQKELAARIGIDGSSLVRLIDILVAKKLIERRQDPVDRRSNLLALTSLGETSAHQIQHILTKVEAQILADFDEAEIQALTSALERIDIRIGALRQQSEPGDERA